MYLTFSQLLQLYKTVSVHSAVDAKRKQKEQWFSIDWNKANRIVKSLQRRIVVAVKENRWGKVKSLQWVLTHSYSAKVLAIRRVTENTGSRTSGVDGKTWNTAQDKWKAITSLRRKGYKVSPVRRIKIPKDNGKYRMLGIPTMKDRAMQALYLQALEPVSETTADMHSYGFRPYRNCHDAIEQSHILLSRKNAPRYILEGDIRACFDKISHQWILDNIPLDKQILQRWLKAGTIDKKTWYPSEEGTPQGSIISPTIANMVLDGLAKTIDNAMGIRDGKAQHGRPRRYNNIHKVNFVRYADDWIVTATNREILEQRVLPAIEEFLSQRGLELSKTKTVITNISNGFDFLGQNFRKHSKDKLIVKPSKKSIKKLMDKIRKAARETRGAPAIALIAKINSMTKGWTMYHRHCQAGETFRWIDYQIWLVVWRWCIRSFRKKGRRWIAKHCFKHHNGRNWTFYAKDGERVYHLYNLGHTRIIRYTKIKANTNPFIKKDEPYFEMHLQKKMIFTWRKRKKLATIFRRQNGNCPLCKQKITKSSGWHTHHKLERYKGGKDTLNNLIMLHPDCHRQVHFWNIRFDGDVPIGAFDSA